MDIEKMLKEASKNEDVFIDIIKNVKTKRTIVVVTDYYADERHRIIIDKQKVPEVASEKIANKQKAMDRLYNSKMDKAKLEYSNKINKPVEMWNDEDVIVFSTQLIVQLKTEGEQIVFDDWKKSKEVAKAETNIES